MADYDSDSSAGGDDIETNVLLGYASKEPTGDPFSQLGGSPIWLNDSAPPSGALGTCKVCNGVLSLLLQLNGDLPERFPGHERRVYVFGCRRKTCRRKEGSFRAVRAVRPVEDEGTKGGDGGAAKAGAGEEKQQQQQKAAANVGETLFGVKSPTPSQANPFGAPSGAPAGANPFAPASKTPKPATEPTPTTETLSETFAQKAKISDPPNPPSKPSEPTPRTPWPADPSPYPTYFVDADKEYLDPTYTDASNQPSTAPTVEAEAGGGGAADDKAAFESSMDKTFQRFADRLAQNPEQILRYEFGGQPLLYAKSDAVGKKLAPVDEQAGGKVQTAEPSGSRMPRCGACGAARVFEMQLTPQAITELEVDEMGVEGMDWGTVMVGVCGRDCLEKGREGRGVVGYVEEWVGVQWEEIVEAPVQVKGS